MKHKLSLLTVLMVAMIMPSVAQNRPRTDPDNAKYSIIGNMQVDNGRRYLVGATGKRIDFTYANRRYAMPTEMADLVVRFDSVTTNPFHPMTKLDFWRYDEEIGEWIYDSEVRQGEQQMESTMKTNIMLVIDNSKSLGGDFKKVQDAAIEFVGQLYRESQGKEIFRVGVIGFSTVKFTKIREISSLNASNYRDIVSFIRDLEMQNGTALYYSMEKALDMLKKDAQNNIDDDEYKESRIYAFTDGLDQASVDDKRHLSTPTEYYDHLRPMMKGSSRERINNQIVKSTIVTVRGGDMTDGQERQFDQRAKAICDDVRKLKDMTQLVSEFKKLAEDLVKNNMVLYCYIPVGANGRVGWTFRDEKVKSVKEEPEEREPGKLWLGIGVEAGTGMYYFPIEDEVRELVHVGVRADATWPLSSWFSIGGTATLGIYHGDLNFRLGPLMKFSFTNGAAIIAGAGFTSFGDGNVTAYMSLGWKFKSPWYINFSANALGGEVGGDFGYSFGIGYSIFGGK